MPEDAAAVQPLLAAAVSGILRGIRMIDMV